MCEEKLREKIQQSIGEASTCWGNLDSAGIFDSDRASKVATALFEHVLEYIANLDSAVQPGAEGNEIKDARETIWMAFEEDEHFKDGYISNIAMLLHDRYGITDYEERSRAAEDILRLIFWP